MRRLRGRIVGLRLGPMDELLARAWRAAGPLQGWLAWVLHATFNVGVTGIVRADDGRVLLLRHRLWPEDMQWGFPGGFAKRGEQFSETVVREVREETGLTVTVGRLLEVRAGDRYRAEVYYEATLVGGIEGLVASRQRDSRGPAVHPGQPAGRDAAAAQAVRQARREIRLAARPGRGVSIAQFITLERGRLRNRPGGLWSCADGDTDDRRRRLARSNRSGWSRRSRVQVGEIGDLTNAPGGASIWPEIVIYRESVTYMDSRWFRIACDD